MENVEKAQRTEDFEAIEAEIKKVVDKYKVKTVALYMQSDEYDSEITVVAGGECRISFGITRIAEHMEETASEKFDAVSFLNHTAESLKNLKIALQLRTMFSK